MIFKNFATGWRNIKKNGIFSVINIGGLSIAIAVVIFIMFMVVDELNFDKFHKNLNQIYTVYEHQVYSEGQELFTGCTPFPLSQRLTENYPEVLNATTYTNLGNQLVKYESKEYKEGPIVCADKNFLDIFSFNVIEGNLKALDSPDQIVITEELATMFFGEESALGKVLKFDNQYPFAVGAVVSKPGNNSTINFKVIVPLELMKSFGVDFTQWGNNWPNTTILLAEGTDTKKLEAQITNLCKDNGQENTSLHLFPYKNERLYSYSGKNNRIQYVYQFLGIAFIIILIASINFINLSIAKAEHRRPEVGIRKVMGASKMNVLRQFLFEKGIMIFISIIVSAVLVVLFLPAFRSISDKNIVLGQLVNNNILFLLLLIVFTIPFLAVIYPSMYLSSINPVLALKKAVNGKRKKISLKSMLVVIQFVLAIVLISGSIIISQQIKYVNNYDLGYNHANLIYLSLDGDARKKHEALKQELSGISGVESITRSDKLPFWGGNSSWGHDWEGKDPENKVLICKMNVDKNYFKTLGIKLTEGNGFPEIYDKVFTPEEVTSPRVILNKEAIRRMGIKDPVGKFFSPWGDKKGEIVGVAEDFHFESLRRGVEPMLLLPLMENPNYIIVQVAPDNFTQTIEKIKKSWAGILPQTNCDLGFFDDRLAELYNGEVKISGMFKYFSFIAIFISCIGLFGLSLFIIERRNKEIGVRKVNGARISEVMVLLNINFVKWVIIAFVIACPAAWYIMNRWLENFAYKTDLSWWIFAIAGVLALSVAVLTVSYHSFKAARTNPVKSLRYE